MNDNAALFCCQSDRQIVKNAGALCNQTSKFTNMLSHSWKWVKRWT